MTNIDTLEASVSALLSQPSPPPIELRKALLELDEFINDPAYQELGSDTRSRLQNLRKELKANMRQSEGGAAAPTSARLSSSSASAPAPAYAPPSTAASAPGLEPAAISTPEPDRSSARSHEPAAEQQMEEAEKLFYSGRYSEAIRLFDRVLQLDARWERARQHRSEAENYLRTGYIPPVALPAEAASAFGKAQSAARVGRYADALALLSKAQAVLREVGIQRWQEGLEFEQKLQESIDAENVYQEGLKLFDQGQVDEAIDRIETAARATGLPKYGDKAQQLRKVKDNLRSIHEALSALSLEPKVVALAKTDLDRLLGEYGSNPALERLHARLETAVPRALSPLKDQVRALKSQAERAETIEDALHLARQAKTNLDQIRLLEGLDEGLDRLQNEIERLLRDAQKSETDLALARTAYESNKNWPVQAARLSQPVQQRFPNDPAVIQLVRSLSSYYLLQKAIRAGIVLVIFVVLFLFGRFAWGSFRNYQLSRTPSATPTATATSTGTPTPTATATGTPTPSATPSLTPTATPLAGLILRDVWARNGCYEGFTATGRIVAGSQVAFLAAERRFDAFNRECVLVEYHQENVSIIGWVLLVDIGPMP